MCKISPVPNNNGVPITIAKSFIFSKNDIYSKLTIFQFHMISNINPSKFHST